MDNWLLFTDVYKLGHMEQYPAGTTEVYSYLHTRSTKKYEDCVFFGLQYLIKKYLSQPITSEMIVELCDIKKHLLGNVGETMTRLLDLKHLGYLPLKIKAIPEGTVVNNPNALMTIVNTHPDFFWLPGYLESFFLHLWSPCTVASMSKKYYEVIKKFSDNTCDNNEHLAYAVHDFGYRGVSSNETAAISGSAHLLHFLGSDTIPAVKLIKDFYGPCENIAKSVPASEHSVMCAFGRDFEFDAFEAMLDTYPTGIVSIVSDTYDIWNVMDNFTDRLKKKIMNRQGKVVFRPDSGHPNSIINGDSQHIGCLNILWNKFGGTINQKGFKILDSHVGLVYGDGIFLERYYEILQSMKQNGFASSNLVVGVGGLLLQQHNRDDMGFSIKASNVKVNGQYRAIKKEPITDKDKSSLSGYINLFKVREKSYRTDGNTKNDSSPLNELKLVYEDGYLFVDDDFDTIRKRLF